ncbi:hypothetical protein [Ignavigranum ruoffiae]|uniref:hypothetical protein n=1 Tax=Ignavigranum ruoffiae TaxID=89093 RepID=UPI0024AE2AC9|nr:hypothetical protein [Ignavigranum ruoffiae]
MGQRNQSRPETSWIVRSIRGILMFIGLLAIGLVIYYALNQTWQQPLLVQSDSQEQTTATTSDQVKLELPEETINHFIQSTIEKNQIDLTLKWQDGLVQGEIPLNFQGQSMTAKFTGVFTIYNQQLAIQLQSIKLGSFPLPLNQAYQNIKNQLQLPAAFEPLADQALIVIDLARLLQIPDRQQVVVQEIKPEAGQIILLYIFNVDDVL